MSTAKARTAHAKTILGPELHGRLAETKVLLVGAGGIGCELRDENIVLTGFGKITLLDLDTIDLSNLNRQFLFRKKDVKQSKALVCVPPILFQAFKARSNTEENCSCRETATLQPESRPSSTHLPYPHVPQRAC
ncbi:hypothetical protein C8F04DRAFT_1126398 [Mycena alexandri]|uniref:THIF-type NAD/FAD binding fold domain-containing protein n=1 Tax=Mycena alexandri TaxID=1745969 RepID=A0AAD6SEQ7_9AGAR|nr:hypothetical protein C8F04DRAFT_1126398 [Mycena alexandri]